MVKEKFLRYVQVWTTSDSELAETQTPSTERQWDLLKMLEKELKELGVKDIDLNEKGYLIGRIPSNLEKDVPVIGFMAHVDTAEDASGENILAQVHQNWDGSPIKLKNNVVLDEVSAVQMSRFKGETIITSDGTTLLGADDKAGIAEIMTAVELLMADPAIPHGGLEVIFTPDEETGCGMDNFPLKKIQSQFCFTFDGGIEGELELECYNAWRCDLSFKGNVIHPGYARGKLVNAVTMASQFVSLLPRNESPEATDGRFGNYWANSIKGGLDAAEVSVMIRDFSEEEGQRRLEGIRSFAKAVEASFPGGTVALTVKEQYKNMKTTLDKYPELETHMLQAYKKARVEPELCPIRGGTDGARLTAMGIPTPNVFAGGMNFHSVREWIPLSSMDKAVRVILALIDSWV